LPINSKIKASTCRDPAWPAISAAVSTIPVDEVPGHQRPAIVDSSGIEAGGHGLTVVGDDANRSIPSAPPRTPTSSISRASFRHRADIITLDRNYRSTQTISPPPTA